SSRLTTAPFKSLSRTLFSSARATRPARSAVAATAITRLVQRMVPPWQRRSQRLHGQGVEVDVGAPLGPHADLAWVGEGGVVRLDDLLAVEAHLEVVALGIHAERMPDAGRDLAVPAGELDSAAFDDVIQAHVVLERVGPRDVVVVGISKAED